MTFAEFVTQESSRKIVLVEIDIGIDLNQVAAPWVPHSPRVWKLTYSNFARDSDYSYGSGACGYFPYGGGGTGHLAEGSRAPILRSNSMIVDAAQYLKEGSIADVEAQAGSFYFDIATQVLYVQFSGTAQPWDFDNMSLGATAGFSNVAGFYADVFYDGRVQSIPEISRTKDPLFYGVLSFDGGSIKLINSDGYFDNIEEKDFYGQKVRILFGGDGVAYVDYLVALTAYIEAYTLGMDSIEFKVQDIRAALSRTLPVRSITKGAYAYLKKDEELVPLAFGKVNRGPAICLNEEQTTSTYNFLVADTTYWNIEGIDAVYVDGVAVAFSNASTSGGTFDLASTVYKPGQKVAVTLRGYVVSGTLVENPLKIMEMLLDKYADMPFTSDFYETTAWAEVRDSGLAPVGLFVGKAEKIIDIIGELAAGILGTFMMTGAGLYTFCVVNTAAAVVKTLQASEYLDAPTMKNDTKEYASSVRVGYNRDCEADEYSYLTDTSRQAELFTRYRLYSEREIKTLLSDADDAAELGLALMAYAGDVIPVFTLKTKTQNIGLELEDTIEAELFDFGNGIKARLKLQVIGISISYLDAVVTITGRYVEGVFSNQDMAGLITWRESTTYQVGQWTAFNGKLFIALVGNAGVTPADGATWQERTFLSYAAGDSESGALGYNALVKAVGKLYSGTTAPDGTGRVNLDAELHATKIVAPWEWG